jgi:hypothetical protein
VALKQKGPILYGLLFNQIWSFAGDGRFDDISQMFLQPIFSHTDRSGLTLGVSSEMTANWRNGDWTVPIYFNANKVFQFGSQPVSIGGSVGWFVARPDSAPDWALRFTVTLLFPRR